MRSVSEKEAELSSLRQSAQLQQSSLQHERDRSSRELEELTAKLQEKVSQDSGAQLGRLTSNHDLSFVCALQSCTDVRKLTLVHIWNGYFYMNPDKLNNNIFNIIHGRCCFWCVLFFRFSEIPPSRLDT